MKTVAESAFKQSATTEKSIESAITGEPLHTSDCAVHNEPAMPNGPCDCGAQAKSERRYVAWLGLVACIQVARWKTGLHTWWWNLCGRP